MLFPVRLHDAVDSTTVLRRLLPVLAGTRGERRVAYAHYDAVRGVLTRRWTLDETGELDEAAVELELQRLHSLLLDDAGGDRPLRPAESAPVWVLRDLLPGIEPEKHWIRVRAIAHDGALMGVLVVAEPRRFSLTRKGEGPVPAAGDVLEMALARAEALAVEIVRTVAEAFGGGRCSLLLVDERGPERDLRLGAAIGLPPAVDAGEVRIPLGSGIAGEVARTRMPHVFRDAGDADTAALVGDDWYTSDAFVSLPLVSRGRLLGVMNLTNFRAGTVDDSEVEQLRLVALCVGLLADHAALPERLFDGGTS